MRILSVVYGLLGALILIVGMFALKFGRATSYGVSVIEEMIPQVIVLIVTGVFILSSVEAWKANVLKSRRRTVVLFAPVLLIAMFIAYMAFRSFTSL